MFRENKAHLQESMFDAAGWLPRRLREGLQTSWATTFYEQVFCRIDESVFAPLYSEEPSCPNVPVNVLVSLEILKSGFGWSDAELYDEARYDLQVRHALGMRDLRTEVFTLRTLYNFRRRVREYAQEEGENLMQRVFEDVTDAQLGTVSVATGWQRMDSTQVLSNLAKWTRLELLVGVLQTVFKRLHPEQQAGWQARMAPYLAGRPHQVCYRIRGPAQTEHLLVMGELLTELETDLLATDPASAALPLLQRVLTEQFVREPEQPVALRPANEMDTASLQSPYDEDATYRQKNGTVCRGGYVVNVSETADPENPVQLLTDVQVEPNTTDDAQLLSQSLDDQSEREISVEQITVDGGYTGPTSDTACAEHKAQLRATHMRGGRSASHHWGWEAYTWEVDEEGLPCHMTCPQGHTTRLTTRTEGRFIAHPEGAQCETCPFRDTKCRMEWWKRAGPTIYVKRSSIDAARRRQSLHPEDLPIRAVVEATVREIKLGFPGSKLPVRGLIRARMVLYGAALMTNMRRLHRYARAQAEETAESDASQPVSAPAALFLWFKHHILPKCLRIAASLRSQAPTMQFAALGAKRVFFQ